MLNLKKGIPMIKVPSNCPKCGKKLEYLSELHLIDTDPQESGIEGNCYKCGTMVYSKFKIFEVECTYFDNDGNEIDKKNINLETPTFLENKIINKMNGKF
jgi:hypothetical protein